MTQLNSKKDKIMHWRVKKSFVGLNPGQETFQSVLESNKFEVSIVRENRQQSHVWSTEVRLKH